MAGAGTFPTFSLPLVFDATNNEFDINEGGPNITVTIPVGTYFWRGDGTAADLVVILEDALNLAGAHAYTVELLGTNGRTVIEDTTGVSELKWSTATFDQSWFGSNGIDTGIGNHFVSSFQVGLFWFPQVQYSEDSENKPRSEVRTTILMNGRTRTQKWGQRTERELLIEILPPNKIFEAEETLENESFERFYEHASAGIRFEFCRDFVNSAGTRTNPTIRETLVIRDDDWMSEWPVSISPRTIRLFSIAFPLLKYVA